MAEETKIGIKLEEEVKPIKKMCERLMDTVNHELEKGIENVDTKELGEAIDIIKDLYEAKKFMLESCYYKSVIEAMEEYGEEEEWEDDGRRGYRGQPRSESGRFMSRNDGRRSNRGRGRRNYDMDMMYDEMDMDYMNYGGGGKMYYQGGSGSSGSSQGQSSGGSQSGQSSSGMSAYGGMRGYSGESGQRDSREGRSGQARRRYYDAKSSNSGNTAEEKKEKMQSLEEYTKELATDVTEMIQDASPEERTLLKQKMQNLMAKI